MWTLGEVTYLCGMETKILQMKSGYEYLFKTVYKTHKTLSDVL